ncbi:MAG TPA: DsbA family protein [Acidimicrobiales bacterium]|nr:DsbA family protein [Acidimicrobiales bacterium]
MTSLDFFFDPGCPWTWRTSRWVLDVAPQRDVAVRWRAFSLDLKNGAPPTTAQGALRIVEAVWADHGDGPIGRLYTEVGIRFHERADTSPDAIAGALRAAGLDAGYLAAAHDDRWDAEIRWSMDEAIRVVGDEVGVPILVFDGEVGLCGPVMAPRPTGAAALQLWDHVAGLARTPGFYELERSRAVTLPNRRDTPL